MKTMVVTIGLVIFGTGSVEESKTIERFRNASSNRESHLLFFDPHMQDYYIRAEALKAAERFTAQAGTVHIERIIEKAKRFEIYIKTGN